VSNGDEFRKKYRTVHKGVLDNSQYRTVHKGVLDNSQYRAVHKGVLDKSVQDSAQRCVSFVKIDSLNVMLTHGSESISTHNRHIYCPILVKFCATDVHIKLLDICQLNTNRRRKGRTVLTAVNNVAFTCAP
jgi:hypothetical protein